MKQKQPDKMKRKYLEVQKDPFAELQTQVRSQPEAGIRTAHDLVKTHPGAPIRLMEQKHFVFRQGQLQMPMVDFNEWFDTSDDTNKCWRIAWLKKPLRHGETVMVAAVDGSWYWKWDSGTGQIDQTADEVAEPSAKEIAAAVAAAERAAAERAAAIEAETARERSAAAAAIAEKALAEAKTTAEAKEKPADDTAGKSAPAK